MGGPVRAAVAGAPATGHGLIERRRSTLRRRAAAAAARVAMTWARAWSTPAGVFPRARVEADELWAADAATSWSSDSSRVWRSMAGIDWRSWFRRDPSTLEPSTTTAAPVAKDRSTVRRAAPDARWTPRTPPTRSEATRTPTRTAGIQVARFERRARRRRSSGGIAAES